ncbi:uncharacterized protein VP01_1105g3 [Puccinia sorghi]|uniref:DUF8040 domain-containing protein n=1 Tax=Puccinia sorghi TaxID=27349 RepID=A0A0L6VT03_9BASI|nr:uncharacterized protein VP01_1105g3 [Puccinia sorghi]
MATSLKVKSGGIFRPCLTNWNLLASYTHSILCGNPQRYVDVLHIPSSTFFFICYQLFESENDPVSKLLSMEEQLAIFLYTTGHNNSNRQAQERFQYSSQTISNYGVPTYTGNTIPTVENYITAPPTNHVHNQIALEQKFNPFVNKYLGALCEICETPQTLIHPIPFFYLLLLSEEFFVFSPFFLLFDFSLTCFLFILSWCWSLPTKLLPTTISRDSSPRMYCFNMQITYLCVGWKGNAQNDLL